MKSLKEFILKWFTIPGIMSFTNKGSSYRITGYYYRYYYKDGSCTDPYPCNRKDANCIGGYGVCGCYIPFNDVEKITARFKKVRFFFLLQYLSCQEREYMIEYKKKVTLLKSFPEKLSREDMHDRLINFAVESVLKSLKRNDTKTKDVLSVKGISK
jgi:hypothetical protein